MNAGQPAFVQAGDGDVAVFLLHGVGGGKAGWPAQLAALAAGGWHAIAWDMPGYGDSAPIEPYTMGGLAEALRALVRHVGAARSVLVGHSMGGMVAQEALAQEPGCADALVLSGTSAAFGKPGGDWQRRFLDERLAPLRAGRSMDELSQVLVPGMMAPGADAAALALGRRVMAAVPPSTYEAALRALAGFDRREKLGAIRVPTLCLAGELDGNAPPVVMRGMADRIPGAAFELLTGVGHLAPIEAPDRFNAALLRFLRAHCPPHGRS
ncbi:MAG TPA: alpha/beta fold hydrolase [Burkholderiaceae bacterium]|nr:alpha/beta fold hydrolase [Burkholderiaceae bacterium]